LPVEKSRAAVAPPAPTVRPGFLFLQMRFLNLKLSLQLLLEVQLQLTVQL
jgi:hypothetical protein